MTIARRVELSRLTVSIPEAAASLGMGETLFRAEVLPNIPRIDVGTRTLVDVEDLRAWVRDHKVTSSASKAPTRRTRSASVSMASGANSPRALEIERRLNEKLAASTAKRLQAPSQVVALPSSGSRRRGQAHG